MFEIVRYKEWGLLIVIYDNPFSSSDLMNAIDAVGVPRTGEDQHGALLIDLRQVSLKDITAADSRRFALARMARLSGVEAEPAAFLLRSKEDFGYIRMHNLWAETLGQRKEEITYITLDLEEALSWIERVTIQPGLACALLPRLQKIP